MVVAHYESCPLDAPGVPPGSVLESVPGVPGVPEPVLSWKNNAENRGNGPGTGVPVSRSL